MKRFLSILLAVLMLAVMLPVTAMADDANYCTIEGANGQFDTLTAAAKAWRESKGVVTSGNQFGSNNLEGSVNSVEWVISGEVATGDGEGVIGNNGAGQSILGVGYFTPPVTFGNIKVKGVNGAKITKTGNSYLVSAPGQNVVYENITFVDTVRIDSNPANLTFKNCKFEAGLRMPHSADGANVIVENCTFTGNESNGYAIFVQGTMASMKINGNTISTCQRGINVQAGTSATVSITGNTITNLTGYTKNDQTYGAAIQLTTGREFIITNNKIDVNTGNAFRFYSGLDADVTISDNIIKAPYLVWNQAELPNEKITSQDNKLTITNPNKAATSDGALDDATVIKAAPTQIIIYPPTDDTPNTTTGNPTTGANDFVGIATAAALMALLGAAALLRK